MLAFLLAYDEYVISEEANEKCYSDLDQSFRTLCINLDEHSLKQLSIQKMQCEYQFDNRPIPSTTNETEFLQALTNPNDRKNFITTFHGIFGHCQRITQGVQFQRNIEKVGSVSKTLKITTQAMHYFKSYMEEMENGMNTIMGVMKGAAQKQTEQLGIIFNSVQHTLEKMAETQDIATRIVSFVKRFKCYISGLTLCLSASLIVSNTFKYGLAYTMLFMAGDYFINSKYCPLFVQRLDLFSSTAYQVIGIPALLLWVGFNTIPQLKAYKIALLGQTFSSKDSSKVPRFSKKVPLPTSCG